MAWRGLRRSKSRATFCTGWICAIKAQYSVTAICRKRVQMTVERQYLRTKHAANNPFGLYQWNLLIGIIWSAKYPDPAPLQTGNPHIDRGRKRLSVEQKGNGRLLYTDIIVRCLLFFIQACSTVTVFQVGRSWKTSWQLTGWTLNHRALRFWV